jgi:hypothetical protein
MNESTLNVDARLPDHTNPIDSSASNSFGITAAGARDPRSFYAGRSPFEITPDDDIDGATGTHRPLTFDVSNNAILGSVDSRGFLHGVARSSGLLPVYGTGLPGVFVDKDLDYAQGCIGVVVSAASSSAETARIDLMDNLIPRVSENVGPFTITRVTFAPYDAHTELQRPVIVHVTRLVNDGTESALANVRLLRSIDKSKGSATLNVSFSGIDETESAITLESGESHTIVLTVSLDRGNDSPLDAIDSQTAEHRLSDTLIGLRNRYGRLALGSDSYFGDHLERQAELARQAIILDESGRHAGSFWGSDANDRPDVWMLDLYYSALPLAQLDPKLCRATIDFFVRYGLPPAAWGNYAAADEGHPLPGVDPVSHSIDNATAAVSLAGAYLDATGDHESLLDDEEFLAYGIRVIELLFASRESGQTLFPTVFISDGPARGDFHTGSNVKAWHAVSTMSRLLSLLPSETKRAETWKLEAEKIRDAVLAQCSGTGSFGPELFEGVWNDGSHVAGHDGEESDLTLASFYGFTPADDRLIVNHALSAFSTDNPYFIAATGGVSWWDFRFHGPTFPAYIHALSAAAAEEQILPALESIRQRTDIDGSLWWWPHLHEETDPANVLRGPGKCGWAAGVYLCKVIHDFLGLRPNAVENTLTFVPFSPWSAINWNEARLGKFAFDVEYSLTADGIHAAITNRADEMFTVEIDLLIPKDRSSASIEHDGHDARETSRAGSRYGRTSVIVTRQLRPGERTELSVSLVPFSTGHARVIGS